MTEVLNTDLTDLSDVTDEVIEAACRAMARRNGIDWDEKCAREIDDDNECESSTCVSCHSEDHDPADMRAWYLDMAKAAILAGMAMRGEV